ncbi:CxxxxCH/CxxCH domain-containing protein [Zhengella sp.]
MPIRCSATGCHSPGRANGTGARTI